MSDNAPAAVKEIALRFDEGPEKIVKISAIKNPDTAKKLISLIQVIGEEIAQQEKYGIR